MTEFKDNTFEGLDLRIDIRTNIGLLKNKINDIEEFRSKIKLDWELSTGHIISRDKEYKVLVFISN